MDQYGFGTWNIYFLSIIYYYLKHSGNYAYHLL
jgi:hypothetical protein